MTDNDGPRTVIYARQSRDIRGDAAAVGRQIAESMALIRSRGLGDVLEPIIDNDVSATSGKPRPGYTQLTQLIERGDVDTVVAWHLDRLLRSLTEMEDLIALCERTGVKIMTVFGELDLSTDMGRLVGRILASVARGEVERKAARQRAQAAQAAAAGKPPSRRAFGHDGFTRLGGERRPIPADQVASERRAVEAAYASLLSGASLIEIARQLTDAGHLTTRGKPWTRVDVRVMLLNPRNAGLREFKGERFVGTWRPIVAEETHLAAVELLTNSDRRRSESPSRRWLGTGLYLCGVCGVDAGITMQSGNHGGAPIYRCRLRRHNSRPAARVDAWVLHTVASRLRNEDIASLLAADPVDADRAATLRADAAGLRKRRGQLGLDYARELLTGEQVRVATEEIDGRLAAIDDRLAAIGRRSQLEDLLRADDPAAYFLGAPLGVKRATIRALCRVVFLPNPKMRHGVIAENVLIDFLR